MIIHGKRNIELKETINKISKKTYLFKTLNKYLKAYEIGNVIILNTNLIEYGAFNEYNIFIIKDIDKKNKTAILKGV